MSKAALVGLVKGLARDVGPRGITINNIHPGPVDTEMNPAGSEFAKTLLQVMALQRYGTGAEIAALAACPAGPEAGYVTGVELMRSFIAGKPELWNEDIGVDVTSPRDRYALILV